MRLRSLDLERYGSFTTRRLAFRPDAALHVVYGPNEAGKSTCLSAIADLLFGFQKSTAYDFLHGAKDLRLGATLARSDGTALSFRRRKGYRRTLLDAQDNELADDALAPFLGGIGRDVFLRAFGLNAAALRASAKELGDSEGDLATALFSAASGLRGLSQIRAGLESEAAALYSPRGKDRVLHQALARFEEARKAVKANGLNSAAYKSAVAEIEKAEARLREIATLKASARAEELRIKHLKAAQPLLRAMDAQIARLAAYDALPPLGEAGLIELERAVEGRESAEAELRKLQVEAREIEQEHDAVHVDEPLVAQGPRTDGLHARIEAYRQALAHRPRLQSEAAKCEADLGELARGLGFENAEGLLARRPTEVELARLQELTDDGRSLSERLGGTRRSLDAEASALEERKHSAPAEALADPAPLRARLGALKSDLQRLEAARAAGETVARELRRLREEAARLRPAVADLEALAAVPLPSAETIERYRTTLAELATRAAQHAEQLRSCRGAADGLRADLAALRHDGAVPTREELEAARASRDAAWRALGSAPLQEPGSPGGTFGEAGARFEALVAQSDRIADDIAADAQKVFRIADLQLRLQTEAAREADLVREADGVERATGAKTEAWEQLWADCGVVPGEPAEMRVWRTAVASLLERRDTLRARLDDGEAAEARAALLRPALNGLAIELRLAPYEGADILAMARYVEDAIEALAGKWASARENEALVREGRRRLERLQQTLEQEEKERAAWRSAFGAAGAAVGLRNDASVAEATAALAAWQRVPGAQKELDGLRKRVRGMERDTIEPFEAEALVLVGELAADLVPLPRDAAVKELQVRLAEARRAKVLRDDLAQRLTRARGKIAAAKAACDGAEAALATAAAPLGRSDEADLKSAVADLKARAGIEEALDGMRRQLAAATEHRAETALRVELAEFDLREADVRLEELAQRSTELDDESREVYARKDREQRELARLDAGIGAEEAHQARHLAETQIADTTRDYLVLKIGSLLVGAALARYRAQNQSPTMLRAGLLFAALTGGAFTGVEQAIGDDDVPRLIARRASGAALGVGEMSEGTVDQLYLALRLAYLQDYASRAEALPFIGDDLFATFDDERAGNGLETLASFGAAVQPILFTHHLHIVDIAKKRLGSKVDVVDLGAVEVLAEAPGLAQTG